MLKQNSNEKDVLLAEKPCLRG